MDENVIYGFLAGLGIGLILCLVLYVREMMKRKVLKKQINDLKNHLHIKMDIDAEASQMKRDELTTLKKENENLRVTNQSLLQKPGRREVLNFHIYQKAVNILSESLVGFPPAWQKAIKEAEEEVKEIEGGGIGFIKKFIPENFLGGSSKTNLKIEDKNNTGDDPQLLS